MFFKVLSKREMKDHFFVEKKHPLQKTGGLFFVGFCFALIYALLNTSMAGPLEPVTLRASTTMFYDSNIYRASKEVSDIEGDTVYMVMLGAKVDKSFSKQRIVIDAEMTKHTYRGADLNYTGRKLDSTWFWAAGDRLKGTLTYNYLQRATSLSEFLPVDGGKRNLERFHDLKFSGEMKLIDGWMLAADYSTGYSRNTIPVRRINNADYDGYGFGGGYNTKRGSRFRIMFRQQDTEYANRKINQSKRTDIELTGTWVVTEKSMIQARLASTKREYAGTSDRNFTGLTGFVRYGWRPTSKIGLMTEVSYDLSEQLEDYSDYAQGPRFKVTGSWDVTPKIGLQMSWSYQRLNFSGRDNPYTINGQERKDTNRGISFSIAYNPIDPVIFRIFYDYSSRGSTMAPIIITDYRAHVIGMSAEVQF